MRRDIAFDAEGATLRGWFYMPEAATGAAPCVVMAHGATGVKEQYLDRYAEVFAAAGLAVLVWDHRGFGASDGTPRQEIDPLRQLRDYRHAITYARSLPEVDRARIGAWGTSLSGGIVLQLAALDRRVRCVVAQVPGVSNWIASTRRIPPEQMEARLARLDAEREAIFAGAPPTTIPVVSDDPAVPAAMSGRDAWGFVQATLPFAPAWRNEVTLRSAEFQREFEPMHWVPRISPTPLLMIVALNDTRTPTDLALIAYNSALEPKKLVLLQGGHFDPYTGARFAIGAGAARDWFVQHLIG